MLYTGVHVITLSIPLCPSEACPTVSLFTIPTWWVYVNRDDTELDRYNYSVPCPIRMKALVPSAWAIVYQVMRESQSSWFKWMDLTKVFCVENVKKYIVTKKLTIKKTPCSYHKTRFIYNAKHRALTVRHVKHLFYILIQCIGENNNC